MGAIVIAAVGFADDLWGLPASIRFVLQLMVGGAVVVGGTQGTPSGFYAFDFFLSTLWIVGITNSFNLLDNTNGLAAGAAAMTSFLLFLMAALQGQYAVAGLAISISGSCVGFLPYNYPRARVFMGDGGSLLLGFLIAVVSLEVRFPIAAPWGLAAAVCFLALPVIDTSVVIVDRLVGRRRVASGGTDHLSHRLIALGLSPATAAAVLLALSGAFSMVGLLAGRGVIPTHVLVFSALAALAVGAWMLTITPAQFRVERDRGRAATMNDA